MERALYFLYPCFGTIKGIFADLFTTDIPCTNCLDAGLAVSAKTCTAIAGGFDDEEQVQSYMHAPIIFFWHLAKLSTTVSIYPKHLFPPLTWAVRTPSRYEVDSSLPKATRASHIFVSACYTFPVWRFPGDCILLFKMPWVWVMAAETKLRKYIHVLNTAKLHKWRNTPCHWTYKWVKYIRHADLSFDSLLTWQEGLASVQFLVTAPFRKQNNFSARYMDQHLLAASTKCSQPCLKMACQ